MFSDDRAAMRRFYIDAWAKAKRGEPLTPLEGQIAEVVKMHPEYHLILEDPDDTLDREWLPEHGESNPFLHIAMHLALLEQVTTDRPEGIRRLYQTIIADAGNTHEAEHRILECLAAAIWHVQHDGKPFNAKAYLKCVKRAGGGRRGGR